MTRCARSLLSRMESSSICFGRKIHTRVLSSVTKTTVINGVDGKTRNTVQCAASDAERTGISDTAILPLPASKKPLTLCAAYCVAGSSRNLFIQLRDVERTSSIPAPFPGAGGGVFAALASSPALYAMIAWNR